MNDKLTQEQEVTRLRSALLTARSHLAARSPKVQAAYNVIDAALYHSFDGKEHLNND